MGKELYDRLVDSLTLRGGALIPQKSKEFYALLEELFTPEEAGLGSKIPFGSTPAEKIAQEAGKSPGEVTPLLEKMADKGLVITTDKGGIRLYKLLPLVPGIFEFQFMKGEVSERTKKLARLFEDYFTVSWKTHIAAKAPSVPFARVIPVEKEIKTGVDVHPYEKVSAYIDNAEHISVSSCYCRHHGELIDHLCDKPKDVCMSFGPSAKFVAERGFGRLVSKKEAIKILDLSEEAGLVHCSSNTSRYIDFICNCCMCHCGILQTIKDTQKPSFGATSNFIVEVDDEACAGCETCIERCQMEALSMNDDVVERETSKCIGCGLCVSTCPSEALKMVSRAERQVPPKDQRELMASMIASMQKKE